MKKFTQNYLPWLLVIILIIILLFFRSCNCGPGMGSDDQKKKQEQDKDKTTGNAKFDSLKIKEILDISKHNTEDIKTFTKTNLNAVHRIGAGVYCVVGDKGEVWVTPNGGLNWIRGNGTGSNNLYGTAVLSYDIMIAVGDKGTIIRSSDKGLNWVSVKSGTAKNIKSVSFPDFNTGYAVGQDGLILKTADAGLTWAAVSFSPSTVQINSVCFINASTGWFAGKGGVLYKTVSAAGTWLPESSNTSLDLNCISFNSLSRGTAVGEKGVILNTTNGGATWSSQIYNPPNNLNGVHRVSNVLAYIVGKGIIIRENIGVNSTIKSDNSKTYNAVDPSPYISGIAVGSSGDAVYVNTQLCDDCNQTLKGSHDVVFLPPSPEDANTNWKIRLRIYNDQAYDFKRFLRVITPGLQMDHSVLTGWTQNDNTNTQNYIDQDNNLSYYQISNSSSGSGNISVNDIDIATLDMMGRQTGYIELSLTPNENNTYNNGMVEFYFGKLTESSMQADTSFCYKVTYNLGE